MAFVVISYCCSVELRFRMESQRCALTLGMYRGQQPTEQEIRDLADFMGGWWNTAGRQQMGSHVTMYEVYVRDLGDESAYAYSSTLYTGVAGNLTVGTPWPGNVAFCVSFRSTLRGRANRGRNYWFGFGTSQKQAQSTVTATYRNAVLAFYQRLLPGGASDPTPWVWSILSRQSGGVVVGRHVPISSVIAVDDTIDSQRRRLPGRGL